MPWEETDGSVVGIVGISREVTAEIEAKERLQGALEDREMLHREVHHRTKNNLQLVVSMLNLQKHILATDSAREALDQARSRVHSMAMLHEHLHRSPDVGQLKLGEYLEAVVAHATGLARAGLSLTVSIESDECLVDLEQGVHVGLIVNELVTNAVKHAFVEQVGGTITVQGDHGTRWYLRVPEGRDTTTPGR